METDKPTVGTSDLGQRIDQIANRPSKAFDARFEALKIAFAPFVFQATKVLKDSGILAELCKAGARGVDFSRLKEVSGFSNYGMRVLLDSGEASGVLTLEFADDKDDQPRSCVTQVGRWLETDKLTSVQFDFAAEVCYHGMAKLEESLREEKPAGLSFFGSWKNVYQALSSLPQRVREAWLDFDHFFSDEAFGELQEWIKQQNPKRILDVGGNTGRLGRTLLKNFSSATITIADLPQQLAMAKAASKGLPEVNRLEFFPTDLLSETPLPPGQDAITMSQFLDCFSEPEIVAILKKAAMALNEAGRLYILETLVDRQKYKPAQFCVAQISLYFTAIANGNSQMYRYATLRRCLECAGFEIIDVVDQIGRGHSLLICRRIK